MLLTLKHIKNNNQPIFNMKSLRFIIIFFIWVVSLPLCAQTACDKLFASGVKLQQTMTVASQHKAISYFEKAKVCYDSQTKKNLCDQQIKACKNIISQLSKKAKSTAPASPKENVDNLTPHSPVAKNSGLKRDVKLSIESTYLKFKGKGGEFKKTKVNCNYADWVIAEKPDWVNCSRNEDGEIVVEAEKNPNKEERSGTIVIECGGKSVSLTIIQEKFKKFGII